MATFKVNDEDFVRLQEEITRFGNGAEQVINEYLVTQANDTFIDSITNLIPVSDRNKRHAKQNAPLVGEQRESLELYIHTRTPYHYLYFPEEGLGTSLGQDPHDFMVEGAENEYDNVVNGVLDALMRNINL